MFLGILAKFNSNVPVKIFDIGGLEAYWKSMNFSGFDNVHITLLHLEQGPTEGANFTSIAGDATNLSNYKDDEFDIVYLNSVIEHLYTFENQQKMANEARRVGKYYYIQTPNLYFIIEPHWLFPFFQFLPNHLKLILKMNFNLGHYRKVLDRAKAFSLIKEVQLLTTKQMNVLCTDGKLHQEYLRGFVKSITMYTSHE